MTLLSIQGLSKEFRSGNLWASRIVRAVDSVSLDANTGETLGLVGESGSGKTTLVRCALRLAEPTAGAVFFDGEDLHLLPRDVLRLKRREFQIVFQDPFASLDPGMTVREILREPFEVHRLGSSRDRERWVGDGADAVALDRALLDRLPGSLSGGQQQRVGIARALALRPRLLVADEPVSALDASVQAQVLNLLADLQKRFNLTLILISHSLQVIHYMCSRVAVMYLGRIVEEASAETFFAGPAHPYSQLLLQSMPGRRQSGGALRSQPQREIAADSTQTPGCAFRLRCPHARSLCSEATPVLRESDSGSKVACFLYT